MVAEIIPENGDAYFDKEISQVLCTPRLNGYEKFRDFKILAQLSTNTYLIGGIPLIVVDVKNNDKIIDIATDVYEKIPKEIKLNQQAMKRFDATWLANRNQPKTETKHKGKTPHKKVQEDIYKSKSVLEILPGKICKFKSDPQIEMYSKNWHNVRFIIQNRIDEHMNAKHYISYNVTIVLHGEVIGQDRISETQLIECKNG